MSVLYREEPGGKGRAGLEVQGWDQVGTEGCWENLEGKSALICKTCTSFLCPRNRNQAKTITRLPKMPIKKAFFSVHSECTVLLREELPEKNHLCNWCAEELHAVASYHISMESENTKLDVSTTSEVITATVQAPKVLLNKYII
jgi:hypothetical protein